MSSSRVRNRDRPSKLGDFSCYKVRSNAERPSLENGKAGWEITFINRTDNRVEDEVGEINNFDTGLCTKLSTGSYIEIVPHPQLINHGYMIPGPVIIDSAHTGNLTVPLYKFREGDDIELPFRGALAFMKVENKEEFKMIAPPGQNSEYQYNQNQSAYNRGAVYPSGMTPAPQALGRPMAQRTGNHMF